MSVLERKLEKISCVIERLKGEVSTGALLVVEGEKDVEALREIGIMSDVIAIKSCGKNLPEIIDEIVSAGSREIILLMDFDRHGKELIKRLAEPLEAARIKVELSFWQSLSNLLSDDVKDVEGLAKYIRTLRRKVKGDWIDQLNNSLKTH
ncbi:MAG: toprim domain-containing protein [Candidatus Bathyarchaeota archaeon]|nr:toprim domain-containing protein [Candidatus Bathyarchaeota archaeon]